MDFMSEALDNGHRFRMFSIVDDYNREALAIEIDLSLPAARVICILDQIFEQRGYTKQLRSGNGPEFITVKPAECAETHSVHLEFITPGKSTQNSYVERFNRSYRDAVLDAYIFQSLDEVREQRWTRCEHSSLSLSDWRIRVTIIQKTLEVVTVAPKHKHASLRWHHLLLKGVALGTAAMGMGACQETSEVMLTTTEYQEYGDITVRMKQVTFADGEGIYLEAETYGWGLLQFKDGTPVFFSWDNDNLIDLQISDSTVSTSDDNGFFCIFDNGTNVEIKNRLGYAVDVLYDLRYSVNDIVGGTAVSPSAPTAPTAPAPTAPTAPAPTAPTAPAAPAAPTST